MENKNNINEELNATNFKRMKTLSIIFISFGIFAVATDYSSFNPWDEKVIEIYKILDIIFTILSLFAVIYFWSVKNIHSKYSHLAVKFTVSYIVLWAVLVCGLDFSVSGFSTYIAVLLLSLLYLNFKPLFFMALIWVSTILLISIIYLSTESRWAFIQILFMLLPISLISTLISLRYYKEKIQSLNNFYENKKLTQSLEHAKNNLKKEVEEKTKNLTETYLQLEKTELISNLGGWSIDVKTMDTYLSKGVWEIYEIGPELVLTVEEGIKFYVPEHRPVIEKAVQECMQSGTPYELETEIITAKGNKRWVRTGGSAETENDSIVKITGFLQDITKLKVAEIELQSAYQQLQANEQQLMASFQQLAASEQQLRANNQQLSASERELILAKEKAEKSEEKFRKAIMTNPDAITINRLSDGVYVLANEGFYKTFGYSVQEIIGVSSLHINIWQNIEQRDEYKNLLEKNGFIENFEAKFVSKTGKTIHCLVSSSVIELDNVKHTINITKDISQLKAIGSDLVLAKETAEESERELQLKNEEYEAINEELLQTNYELIVAKEKAEQSDRLKSAFLANMSHEIRTPMNGILGFAHLLKDSDLSGDEQQEYIGIIEKSGKRMLNIINDIVDISKIEAGLMESYIKEFNINEQLDYTYTFFKPEAEAKGINLSFKTYLPNKEATITSDGIKVYAILTNLVKNSIKYTEKGSIEFGYNLKKESEHKQLEFFVKDTGIGIPKDRQEAIFERFIQADIADKDARQGAGLGLSIAKAYVEFLGGKIWVESEAGKGSTFYFTLPYNAEAATETIEQPLTAPVNNNNVRKLKIMIAEDDETSEILIEKYIKILTKEILKARTGFEAVEVCRNNPDIDLILMDIQMPVMNGYDATRQIRQFNRDVNIIAQTAFGLSGDREKAIVAGCNDYIAKPINKDELLMLIQKFFKN